MNVKSEIRIIPLLISTLIGLIIWFIIPVPKEVSADAWHLLALFIGTIIGIISKAMPIGALSIIAICLVAITGVTNDNPALAIKDALSGFSYPLIWLIGIAILISRGIIKTGLGNRIAYYVISIFGKNTLGIAYSLTISELFIAPVTPSNTARGGAILHPIMRSIALSFGSSPDTKTEGTIGRYLALVNYHANPISSTMFITATAPNPLIVNLIAEATNSDISITWGMWALAFLIPGLVALALMPLVIYFFSPPEIKKTPDAPSFAKEHLQEMGQVKYAEKVMIGVFILLLTLWAGIPAMLFGPTFAVHSTVVAFLGLSILLISNVLSWQDVLEEKTAWDTIIWFSALVMMATFLNKLGLITWFSQIMELYIDTLGLGWQLSTLILVVIYFYTHYFFASTTAHITAMFAAFYGAGLALGAPPIFLALILASSSSLMMSLTHYATGTSPVIFGSKYVSLTHWWKIGFIMSIVNLSIFILVGGIWWKILGYW